MKLLEYFTTCEDREYWLERIEGSDWGGGRFLAQLLREGSFRRDYGETALVLMLTEGDRLISFCTLAPLDDIQPTELFPWIGFVYTFPEYRGHHYAGLLLDRAECIAAAMGREAVYISSGHVGLYERYGYEYLKTVKCIRDEDTRIYRKLLNEKGPERDGRYERGMEYKAEIVRAARRDTDPVAVCGLSCRHCFLSENCGGCRSSFNCCSFGTLFEKGRCPNAVCAREKGLEGCYECPELLSCGKGFYSEKTDGVNAIRALAVFIGRHGKETYFRVYDKLHELYRFDKIQEVLSPDLNEALEKLEETARLI